MQRGGGSQVPHIAIYFLLFTDFFSSFILGLFGWTGP